MLNLNPRYAMIDYNIDYVKNTIKDMDPITLLDLCPRMRIPRGSLFYHSTKLSSADIENYGKPIINNQYPMQDGCYGCQFVDTMPEENVGDKPRIMELTSNPNKRKGKNCICLRGRQERLYGNFNFAGNYDILLGKSTILKGTEILLSTEEIVLIDLNYLSIELGFSPKRFVLDGQETHNNFGIQHIWTKYCQDHQVDGLIMVDIIDTHKIDLTHKTNLSCYQFIDLLNDQKSVVCPEFVLLAKPGHAKSGLGTDKLKILGMVDLYDQEKQVKLNRDQAEKLFQLFFTRMQTLLNDHIKGKLQLTITYYQNFTLFKTLSIEYEGTDMDPSFLFQLLKSYVSNKGDQSDFYLTINDYYDEIEGHFYKPDIHFLDTYNKVNLELDVVTLPYHIELYTDVIIKNVVPRENQDYYYQDGSFIKNYVSDLLFDYLLNKIASTLKINSLLYVHYHELSSIKNYTQYTLEEFRDYQGPLEKHMMNHINQLEFDLLVNFYLNCYVKMNQLNDQQQHVKNFLHDIYDSFILSPKMINMARNKTWAQFKTTYLEPVEKYICHFNGYDDVMKQTMVQDNLIIQILYNQYDFNISLDDLLKLYEEEFTPEEQKRINLEWFDYYTQLLKINNTKDLYKTFNEFIDNISKMII